MGIAELDPIIRIRLIVFLIGYFVFAFIFRTLMRNYLKIEKKERFFKQPINNKHKKINRMLTVGFVGLLIGTYFYETRVTNGVNQVFVTGVVMLGFIVVTEVTKAYMEWKYSENKKEYLLTISELVFSILLIVIAYANNLFGLFR